MCSKAFSFSSFYLVPFSSLIVNIHAYSCFSTADLKISPSLHSDAMSCRPEMTLNERVITAQSNGEEKWQWGNVAKTTVWKSISELLTNSGCSYSSGYLYCDWTPGPRAFLGVTPWWNPWILSQGGCSHSRECCGWWAQPHICCTVVHLQWNQQQPWGPRGVHVVTLNQICPRALKSAQWCKIWNNHNWEPELVLQKDWYLLLK